MAIVLRPQICDVISPYVYAHSLPGNEYKTKVTSIGPLALQVILVTRHIDKIPMPYTNCRGPRYWLSYYRLHLMSNRYKKSWNRKYKQWSKADSNPSYMCDFMGLSLAIEKPYKKFLCKSGIFSRDKFKESAHKWLRRWPTTGNSNMAPKQEVVTSLELIQIASKLHWQIRGFRPWQVQRKCSQTIATTTGNSNMAAQTGSTYISGDTVNI